jgi:probable FeS assembly SUF system protein SufT
MAARRLEREPETREKPMAHAGQQGQEVRFTRACEVVQIPAGTPVRAAAGTTGIVTQALGGSWTLQIPSLGGLFRLPGADADAIGFERLAGVESGAGAPAGDLEAQVWQQLKTCYDPEIPVNIVDLGLVYDLRIGDSTAGGSSVNVKMTLTAQGCGMGTMIAADAQQKIEELKGVGEAKVEIVWDPPWNPRMISPEGREKLGI